MSKSEKKLVDIAKYLRRFNYKVKDFFKYRVMVNSKHMLLIGGNGNPLTPLIYKEFQSFYRIAHYGNQEYNAQLHLSGEDLPQLVQEAKKFSSHYEAIIVLEDAIKMENNVDILREHQIYQEQVKAALVGTHLATKILASNGFLCYTVDEDSYFEKFNSPVTKLIKDCQLQHLTVNLGEREDLENDTLILALLINQEHKEIVKYLKMWCDGIKRPASGTFVQFKWSDHKKAIIYPELL